MKSSTSSPPAPLSLSLSFFFLPLRLGRPSMASASSSLDLSSLLASFSRNTRSLPQTISASFASFPPAGRCLAPRRTSAAYRGRRTGPICATEVSVEEQAREEPSPTSDDGRKWVPVVPLSALPKGERRVIIQNGETILLLWYKDDIFAIENRSPAEGAYTEGLLNAKLTQDGCIVCPTTDSTFDLKTGAIREWYPKNPVLRVLTPALQKLFIYPVKTDEENIYISMAGGSASGESAEIVFSGKAQPGVTASDVNVDEVRMVIDEDLEGFGFSQNNEVINGKAAVIGFLLLLDFELLTGKGLLKGTGILDFIYAASRLFSSS